MTSRFLSSKTSQGIRIRKSDSAMGYGTARRRKGYHFKGTDGIWKIVGFERILISSLILSGKKSKKENRESIDRCI